MSALFGTDFFVGDLVFARALGLVGPLKSSVWRWPFGFLSSSRMLPMKGLTHPFFRGFGVGLSLFYLFFFGDLVALIDDFFVPLGISRKGPMVALHGGLRSDHR